MIVTLQDVNELHEALDCEVFHDKIVVECDDGFWYCLCDNKADNIDDVKFMNAKPWMVQAMARLQGKGLGHVDDQLRDMIDVQVEELDDRGYSFEQAMPGSSSDPYSDVSFDSFINGNGY